MCRWTARYTTITGTTAISEAAKIRPQLVLCWPRNRAMPIGSVRLATSLMTVSAQMNSSQLPRNVKIAHVASAGRDSGSGERPEPPPRAGAVDHHRLVELDGKAFEERRAAGRC